MNKEHRKFIDDFINKHEKWFFSRLWDDDCICPNEETVDPKCPNKRCIELNG